jgi:hypothetical protein
LLNNNGQAKRSQNEASKLTSQASIANGSKATPVEP